ncbi:prepilin-type N-terminal cleavage/methylation domain-containing protein [Celeribacter baekdonensis]|jgi:Tfp pilus assembly protein PilV|uniref:type II secretion system protein n=1 Tax=Celeribacter baekdonensis TaxID=875171 RepID=UPI0030DBB83D|tara:strand:+ start:368465 stop:368809 length:345 start_codon:yes stop_codon:yes gene_type:complete
MSKRAGYSLFEVLIAFAIMTMVLSALIPGQATLLRRSQDAADRVLAMDYAISVIDQIRLEDGEGFAPDDQGAYGTWRVEIASTMAENENRLTSVTITSPQGQILAQYATLMEGE